MYIHGHNKTDFKILVFFLPSEPLLNKFQFLPRRGGVAQWSSHSAEEQEIRVRIPILKL
jgi:hypothetical protein